MKISQNQNSFTQNFKAIKIANTRNTIHGVSTDIELFKLTKKDIPFLQKLLKNISLKNLYPKLEPVLQERWQKVFEYCINQAINCSDRCYIAISENKPCGILTYLKQNGGLYLDGICAIPTRQNKKTANVGTTLFYQIFKDAKEDNAKNITLSAVQDGPFDVVDKYEKLGFKKDVTSYPYKEMRCNKYEFSKQITELSKKIDYQECEPENVNLEIFLN